MQVLVLPDTAGAEIELLDRGPMSDDEFLSFCSHNPDLRIERDAGGKIIVMPPCVDEASFRNTELVFQLTSWARRDGRGRVFESSAGFILPNGAILSPDASWISKARLELANKEDKHKFRHLCPEFVVELRSPSDRLPKLKAKMQQWIDNGAQLAWLIDADRRTIHVYRTDRASEELTSLDHIIGEGPVEGFRLELQAIWQGL